MYYLRTIEYLQYGVENDYPYRYVYKMFDISNNGIEYS